jgi:uncharacterized protein GlcG (DUF336 family)
VISLQVLRSQRRSRYLFVSLLTLLGSCGGGGGGTDTTPAAPVACSTCNADTSQLLTVNDTQTIIAQAVGEASARGLHATISISDRVGNILAVYRMTGASQTVLITSFRGVVGGLEGFNQIPDTYASVSKAVTAAYLSSNGNAFSTRTASQIVQENFDPGETDAPAGPLFGVQFSSLTCGDFVTPGTVSVGPHSSPLGLSAGPGGLPLYKNGVVVGGIGVVADALYTFDTGYQTRAPDVNELIAEAGTYGYAAPSAITADKISAGGLFLRYTNPGTLTSNPATHAAFATLSGALVAAPGFTGAIIAGQAFGASGSGIRADTRAFADLGGFVLVDATNTPRFPPTASADGSFTQADVTTILRNALQVANHARAQIRQPLNTTAQVSITVVDRNGKILGLVRSPDAPVFGLDVAVQKARTSLFFSDPNAAATLAALPPAIYPATKTPYAISNYLTASQSFFSNPAVFADGRAYSTRAVGEISRPFYPDGINGNPSGPLSKPFASWSIFDDGLQLDMSLNAILAGVPGNCTGVPEVPDGLQIFAGSVPIYKNGVLIGAIGVSGDGTSQDDMVAFLGLNNGSVALGNGIGNAPANRRADQLAPGGTGTHLDYVVCPQTPFVDTNQQDVCTGL